jgi:hypothetical protein
LFVAILQQLSTNELWTLNVYLHSA